MGRLDDERFTGGTTDLVPTGSNAVSRNRVFRYHPARPGMVSVQLSYQLRGTEQNSSGQFPRLFAEVSWQCGSGVQTAEVDIPCSFTISAAEFVEVTGNLVSDPGATVRVFGTAAPAAAVSAFRPYQTAQKVLLNAGNTSPVIPVPQFASHLHLANSVANVAASILLEWSTRSDAFDAIDAQTFPGEDTVPIPGNARGMRVTNPTATNCRVTPIWELSL